LTYLQRYSLVQMLGLAAAYDDDDDSAAGNGVITDEQAKRLQELVVKSQSDIDAFLRWIDAESIPDIKASPARNAAASGLASFT